MYETYGPYKAKRDAQKKATALRGKNKRRGLGSSMRQRSSGSVSIHKVRGGYEVWERL